MKNSKSSHDFFIVGIGASAGGVTPLKELFAKLPQDTGMAFVVILHLSQTHESNLAEILQKQTQMRVMQVRETIKVEPNHVYVIPPAKHLVMVDGEISLTEPERVRGTRVPIDRFFRTLADTYEKKSVAVVLSGTGSDGTLGLKRIKEAGGIAFVQAPHEAEYDDMPRSAINTGLADLVLPVAEMPAKLAALKESSEKFHFEDGEKPPHEIDSGSVLREVLAFVRVRTAHDFSNYKQPTLLRRVVRRMQVNQLEEISAYLDFLREHPEEAQLLLRDLLISVTNFFRDKEAFDALEEKVIPRLFDNKTARDTVRVWVCGCATGEEAYSIAMLLCEHADKLTDPPKIQIFASDIDERAVAVSREHRYDETISVDVSPERLQRFFAKEGSQYRVKKQVREMVLFAPHNVLRDPPFSRLDLVTCRNLLIYLNKDTQEKVLDIFNFALNDDGFLFLGSSESAESPNALYSIVDKKHRIYKTRTLVPAKRQRVPAMPVTGRWEISLPEVQSAESEPRISYGEIHHRLVEHYAPPSVLINENDEIMHLSENAGRFLRFTGGEPTRSLLKVAHPALRQELRTAILAARQENRRVEIKNIRVDFNDDEKLVNFTVQPFDKDPNVEGYLLVIFEEKDKTAEEENVKPESGESRTESVVRHLEEELDRTKNRLRATIEQHETSVEELKASNEELQAINEELRSASEELETSREELQSVNEELTTVNHELKEKVEEVSRANSDLQNLMAATEIGTIFLDRALQIKRYTLPVQELFNIIPSDVGRPLDHLTHKLDYENLTEDAAEVLQTLRVIRREVRSASNKWYIAHLLPYRTVDDRIDGVVVNFLDITERKRAEEAKFFLASIVESSEDSIITVNFDNVITSWNRAAESLYGYPADEAIGKPLTMLTIPEDLQEVLNKIDKIKHSQAVEVYDTLRVHKDGRQLNLEIVLSPVKDAAGQVIGVSTIARDITERKRADEALRESEERSRALIGNLPGGAVFVVDRDLRYLLAEGEALSAAGFKTEDLVGRTIYEVLPSELADNYEPIFRAALSGEPFEHEHDAHGRWYISRGTPLRSINGEVFAVLAVSYDITDRKKSEQAVRESEENLRLLVESVKDHAILTIDNERRVKTWNTGAEKIFGWTEAEIIGQSADVLFTPEDRANNVPEKEVETARANGRASDERWHTRKDGSRFFASGAMTLLGESGERGFVKIARDLTERKRFEETLKDQDRRKDEFLATLAHELRNPLAPIRSGLEIIRHEQADDKAKAKALGIINRQTEQIVNLVDDLLDVSRISQGKIKLKKERINLADAVNAALESSRPFIESFRHKLIVSLPDEPLYVDADVTRIMQIVQNLLNNAAKYTEPGGEIVLTTERENGQAVLRIKDTGYGIPPDLLPRVFDMFMQIARDERPQSGLGIGLSLVKKLVEMHGGDVRAFSEGEGRGAEFVVRLPLASDDGKPPASLKDESSAPEKPIKKKILVVDDNADAADMISYALQSEGHEVITAYDGASAIETAARFEPQAVLLDIGMPDLDGYEVAQRLRKQFANILLIALSGWGQDEDRRRSAEAGFNHHLVKPVKIEEVSKLLG